MQADLPAHAVRIDDEAERRRILSELIGELAGMGGTRRNLEEWVDASPLFAVQFDD